MNEDEEILARIGKHVRDEQKDDARLERVARGEASAAEIAELEADAELALRLEASRPFDEVAVARIAAKAGPKKAASIDTAAEKPKTQATSYGRRIAMIAGPLALAAAIFLYLNGAPKGPELPGYEISATSEQAMRGPSGPDTRIHVGGSGDARFEIVARPATATPAKVVAYGFLILNEGSRVEPLEAKIEISPDGAVKVTGHARALEGAREVRVVIGPPESIGKFEDAAMLAQKNESSSHVRVLGVAIDR